MSGFGFGTSWLSFSLPITATVPDAAYLFQWPLLIACIA
jgi:hypothetical protein